MTVYSKKQFKKLWEANDSGSGLTYDDIADCAKDWGLYNTPRIHDISKVKKTVLEAAGCNENTSKNMKTQEILKALTTIKPGLGSKELVEQSTSFIITKDKISSYNDEISISYPINIGFTGVVKADEFYQFLSKVKTEEVQFSEKEDELIIKAGRSKAGIKIDKEIKIEIPSIPEKEWQQLPNSFSKSIKFVSTSASTDASTPALTCIHIRPDGIIEATDRYRACRYQLESITNKSLLIPADVIPQITSINPIQILFDNHWIHFKNDNNVILSCKVFSAEYPVLDDYFKKEKGQKIKFSKKLIDIIDKAEIFAKREHVFDQFLEITLEENKVTVYSYSQFGWFKEFTKAIYKGKTFKFNIVPKILKDIIQQEGKIYISSIKILFEGDVWKYVGSITNIAD